MIQWIIREAVCLLQANLVPRVLLPLAEREPRERRCCMPSFTTQWTNVTNTVTKRVKIGETSFHHFTLRT